MKAIFEKSRLSGSVKAPPSKSMAHRLIIASSLSGGESEIFGIEYSDDIEATLDCAEALGAAVSRREGSVKISGAEFLRAVRSPLCCRESGSTLRFFIPLAMMTGQRVTLCGSDRLMARPLSVYAEIANENSILFDKKGNCITVLGKLPNKKYTIDGSISSQFITGLLFALSSMGGGEVHVIPPFESRPYVELTAAALRLFGAETDVSGCDVFVRTGGLMHAWSGEVEGDFSNAAFLDAFNLLGGDVRVLGLPESSAQGDAAYREYFRQLSGGTPKIDLADTPDLAPILFALAACMHGAVFTGTRRLAAKESDRGAAMAEELLKFGVRVTLGENEISVPGGGIKAPGCPIFGHGDHRVVMACSTLLTLTGGELVGCEAVNKSYPSYFGAVGSLGAKVKITEE